MNLANKVKDLRLEAKMNNIYEAVDDLTSFSLPEVEYGEGEVTGSGLGGTLNVPDINNISAMTFSIAARSLKERYAATLSPDGAEFRASWAVDNIGANVTAGTFTTYTAVVKGNASGIPGGDIEKGNPMEVETEYACWYYKMVRDGKVLWEIDITTGTLIINGVDYGARLREAMNQA